RRVPRGGQVPGRQRQDAHGRGPLRFDLGDLLADERFRRKDLEVAALFPQQHGEELERDLVELVADRQTDHARAASERLAVLGGPSALLVLLIGARRRQLVDDLLERARDEVAVVLHDAIRREIALQREQRAEQQLVARLGKRVLLAIRLDDVLGLV